MYSYVFRKEDAIKGWRALMGATNPDAAEADTLRKLYGKNIDNNAVHGSDAPETAAEEVKVEETTAEAPVEAAEEKPARGRKSPRQKTKNRKQLKKNLNLNGQKELFKSAV